MELTGRLKDNVAKAKDKKEAQEIIGKAGMLLTDDELDAVSGGVTASRPCTRRWARGIDPEDPAIVGQVPTLD